MLLGDASRRFHEDQQVEEDVRAELRSGHGIPQACFLGVSVNHGVVHLTGFAESYAQKCAIERAASRVIGVRDVLDYIEVRPSEQDQGGDNSIERAAQCALEWDARVPAGIRVEVTNGVLRLDGTVDRFTERDAAEDAVRNLIGVRHVVNAIKLTRGPLPIDLGFDVESAIRRRFGVACRHVWIVARKGEVTLSGLVPSFAMLDEIEHTVRSIPGVTGVDNRLLVA